MDILRSRIGEWRIVTYNGRLINVLRHLNHDCISAVGGRSHSDNGLDLPAKAQATLKGK